MGDRAVRQGVLGTVLKQQQVWTAVSSLCLRRLCSTQGCSSQRQTTYLKPTMCSWLHLRSTAISFRKDSCTTANERLKRCDI